MKWALALVIVVIAALQVSCWGGYSISNIDKPPPDADMSWVKPGADRLEVGKKLMECGLNSPSGAAYRDAGLDINDILSVDFCMENVGYKNIHGYYEKTSGWCRDSRYKNLAICAPGAEIPTPSVERRMNSDYCKGERSYEFCKSNAVNPSACETMDFNNPPAECLP